MFSIFHIILIRGALCCHYTPHQWQSRREAMAPKRVLIFNFAFTSDLVAQSAQHHSTELNSTQLTWKLSRRELHFSQVLQLFI
jgi:hypothetical protein